MCRQVPRARVGGGPSGLPPLLLATSGGWLLRPARAGEVLLAGSLSVLRGAPFQVRGALVIRLGRASGPRLPCGWGGQPSGMGSARGVSRG